MIIFLYGPDTFRSRQKLKELKNKFIAEIDKAGLNITNLNGEDLDVAEFERSTSAMPFLAKKRLVIIENLIAKNKGQKIQKEILEILAKNHLDDTILIFWEGDLEAGKTKKPARSKTTTRRSQLLFDRLKKEKYCQCFPLLDLPEVKKWLAGEVKNRDGKIDSDAAALLTDFVGNDLWQLNSEVDKLLAANRGGKITAEGVQLLVKTKLDDDIFRLTDALGQKNRSLALKLIADQLQSGTGPTELLSKIIWQFKNLLLVKSFMEKNGAGYNDSRLNYQLGLHPFVIKKTLAQAKHHDLKNLKSVYRQLLNIDYKIKTSATNPEVLFDLLVVKN